ncbi:energy transducer TonB, partial [Dokdonella sp.]|uniref:energy transducer TonB n=1 Tax=Dokdonella sp. TaxID=2291710 RepID=UPI003C529C51
RHLQTRHSAATQTDDFHMIRFLIFFLAQISLSSFAMGENQANSVTIYAEWKMSLRADGKIAALELKPGRVRDVLRNELETAIRLWEFEPGSVNGVNAATDTTLIVQLTISPNADGDGFSIVVDRAETGGAIETTGRMPAISWAQAQGMKRDKGAKNLLVLLITYDESGVPEQIEVADESPIEKGLLVSDAIEAVRTWRFDPEHIDGKGLRARALVPICYEFDTSDRSAAGCEWNSPYGNKAVPGRDSIVLDSSVTLKSDVIGKTL